MNVENNRISFSMFTTCYKSFHKIKRAYESIKAQEFIDWEWVILDDTPNDTEPNHFEFLSELFKNDNRVRLYKRSDNSGNIGNVKNEAVLLCRGKYVLEMDHDDELMPYTLRLAFDAFEKDSEIGFVYMNTCNIHEDGSNFNYGNHFCLGYGGYYCQKHGNNWVYVASSPNINDVSLSHIVAVPNHPRIWRKDLLIKIGNYCELLPISDDYELFLRTALSGCKIVKINEVGYIQYMNEGYNNFSYIRNSEINRLCRNIYPMYYDKISKYTNDDNKEWKQIWKLDSNKYQYKYSNIVLGHSKFTKQIVFIGYETLLSYIDNNPNYKFLPNIDYIVLDNVLHIDSLTNLLTNYNLEMFKCYSMTDVTEQELVNYFKLIVSNGGEYELILRDTFKINHLYKLNMCDLNNKKDTNKKVILITPSIRPDNLLLIEKEIDFSYIEKWVIVYDGSKIIENPKLFADNSKIIELVHSESGSISGNAQRNFALDYIKDMDGYVYFLDDDNSIHKDLYKLLDNLEDDRMYTFGQKRIKTNFPYVDNLKGDIVEVYKIDSGMMLIDNKLIGDIRWKINKYNADGYFIKECLMKNDDKWVYVDGIMSNYNNIHN
jgi:glycosyltransferase involved in cell wall biosynthesis